jgi:hypothetical protein
MLLLWQGGSGSPSLISSSENPLHSPSATDEDVADDLFSAADQLEGTIGWESVGSGGDPNGNSGLFGDSLYSQNPINSPSSSPAGSPRTSAEVPESNVGRFDNKALDQVSLGEPQVTQITYVWELGCWGVVLSVCVCVCVCV